MGESYFVRNVERRILDGLDECPQAEVSAAEVETAIGYQKNSYFAPSEQQWDQSVRVFSPQPIPLPNKVEKVTVPFSVPQAHPVHVGIASPEPSEPGHYRR
jgi:hypothetical protein